MRCSLFINTCLVFILVLGCIPVSASWVIIDAEHVNPVTNTWIGGDGSGSQVTSQDTSIVKNGFGAIKWTYTFGATTSNNWPNIEMLNSNKNWTGATSLGVWMYFDLTSTKTDWTIEPAVMYPSPTGITLSNWNVGTTGVPNNTWVYHEWTGLDTIGNISNVSHVRFNYHAGDGWAELSKSNQVTIYLDDVTLGGLNEPPPTNTLKLFDMEGSNPMTNSWIGGSENGTQITSVDGALTKHGNQSLKWRYELPGTPGGNYPTIEMAVPPNKSNWTGATTLGFWFLFDLTGPKDGWTIQPNLQHPWPTSDDLGNWNVGSFGITQGTWTWHEWPINSGWDISSVSHIRLYYHAGDGWAPLAKSNNVDIYIDDMVVMGAAPIAPVIEPDSWYMRPTQNKIFVASDGTPPYSWSLSTTIFGTLDITSGNSVIFTAGNTTGTLTITVTDLNLLSDSATITITPTSALMVEDQNNVAIYQRKQLDELFE